MAGKFPSLGKIILTIIAAGIVYYVVMFVLSMITQAIPGLAYNIMELGDMRTFDDPVMLCFFLHSFVMMIGAVALYPLTNLKGTVLQKGAAYGFILWLLTTVPSSYIIFTSMTYPMGFYVDNIVFGLVSWIVSAIIIVKLLD